MNENDNIKLPDQYRQIWDAITALKVKKTKVMELGNTISTDRSHSLLEEYNKELSILTPQLEDLIKKINTNLVTLKEKTEKVERDITNVNLRLKDVDVLGQNEIIDDIQHQKEKKILEKEKGELQKQLDSYQREIAEAELIIKFPNPEDQVKVIIENEAKKKAEALAKEKADREKKELEKKRKNDTINSLKTELTKYKKRYDALKAENQLLRKTKNELRDELEIAVKRAAKYEERINSIRERYSKKIPCADKECVGQLGYINICNVCGRNYETAKTAWKNRQEIKELNKAKEKINRIFYYIFYIQILFGILAGLIWQDIGISVIVIPVIIITIMIWRKRTSKYRKEIIGLKLININLDSKNEIQELKTQIMHLKETVASGSLGVEGSVATQNGEIPEDVKLTV